MPGNMGDGMWTWGRMEGSSESRDRDDCIHTLYHACSTRDDLTLPILASAPLSLTSTLLISRWRCFRSGGHLIPLLFQKTREKQHPTLSDATASPSPIASVLSRLRQGVAPLCHPFFRILTTARLASTPSTFISLSIQVFATIPQANQKKLLVRARSIQTGTHTLFAYISTFTPLIFPFLLRRPPTDPSKTSHTSFTHSTPFPLYPKTHSLGSADP